MLAETKQRNPRVSVLLKRDEFARFDAYCEKYGYKKSTLIARLVRDFLNREKFEVEDGNR